MFLLYRVFLENLHFLRAYKLDKNHMKGKYFYIYHIYILGQMIKWLVITRFLYLLLFRRDSNWPLHFWTQHLMRKKILHTYRFLPKEITQKYFAQKIEGNQKLCLGWLQISCFIKFFLFPRMKRYIQKLVFSAIFWQNLQNGGQFESLLKKQKAKKSGNN